MARDVEADLKVNDKTGPGLKGATRGLDQFDQRVKQTATQTEKGLTASLRRTGARMERDAKGVAGRVGGQLVSGTAQAVMAGGPILVGALAAIGTLGASAISGAIIGGAAAGGVVGGAVIAARDARVKGAFDAMAERITTRLEKSAEPMVPALLRVAQRGSDEFDRRLGGTLDRIFGQSSRYLDPLLDGLLGLTSNAADGFADLVDAARPVVAVLRDDLPVLGRQLGDVLSSMATQGETGARGLHVALRLVGYTIQAVGMTVVNLNKLFEATVNYGRYLGAGPWLKLVGALDQVDSSTIGAQQATMGFERAMEESTAAARVNIATMEQLRDQRLSVSEAQTRLASTTRDAAAAIRDNGRATSNATKAGNANNATLQGLARQINTTRDAIVAQTGSTYAANAAMQTARSTFVRLAMEAGRTAGQANRLADELLGIPKVVTPRINVNNAEALRKARQADAAIEHAARSRTARINVHVAGISAARRAISEAGGATGFGGGDGGFRHTFAAPNGGDGYRSRTGGPAAPLSLTSDVSVTIDGRGIEAMVDAKIRQSEDRQDWRRRNGGW